MENQIHQNCTVGIKKLSEADLGTNQTSHQTHIGLYDDTLNFINTEHQIIASQLIFENETTDLLSLLDFIENPDGSFRSPKIRKGNENELVVANKKVNSVVREIRNIVQNTPVTNWYLLWFGLDTEELVFLLFKQNSDNFRNIENIVGAIGRGKKIEKSVTEFKPLINYLNRKINNVNFEYYEELEIVSQTGTENISKRIIPRIRDIEKANKLFKATGQKGEELLNRYLETQKSNAQIKDFKWLNKSKETGMPYDFEITQNDNSVFFSDAKATAYKFELPIILSTGELKFINENREKYLIHRLYSLNENPKFRVCNNIHTVSSIFLPKYNTLNSSLNDDQLSIRELKLAVPTDLKILNFDTKITL